MNIFWTVLPLQQALCNRSASLHAESARIRAVVSLTCACLCGGLCHAARIEEHGCRDVQEGAADQDHFPIFVRKGDAPGASRDGAKAV